MDFLITGAGGFVGKKLCLALLLRQFTVRAATRTSGSSIEGCEVVAVGSIDAGTNWAEALHGVDTVIHLAARVHVMRDDAADPLEEYRQINVGGTEHLARSAAANGVRRIVYVSSVKVNGDATHEGNRFTETNIPSPQDPYGISKWDAEQSLLRIARETGLEVVIVRPPLVYGAEVKGNFASMLKVLLKDIPLPLASVNNQRSLVYLENLVDALITCATHPAAFGQTYLVSDGEDVSTPDLLRHLGFAMGRPARLFPFPPKLLTWAAASVGKAEQLKRLTGSLQIDSGKIRRELNWTPPYTLQQGLQETAEWYRDKHL